MKPTLRDRNHFIPGGFIFYQPETKWRPRGGQSFSSVVDQLIRHRAGNPHLAQQHNWKMNRAEVEQEVDDFNARRCAATPGWGKFVMSLDGGGPPPKSIALSQADQRQVSAAAGLAKKIWSGVRTINDWIDSGSAPVHQTVANARASICARCPKNGQGDFTTWFTKPAAGAIKKQIEKLAERKLSTPHDAKLNICEVCLCPLKLKVHTPLPFIKTHLSDVVIADLKAVGGCWIIEEMKK